MYKSPFTENDATMSVGSEDDMRITYDPSFEAVLREGDDDDDSSTVPPPPPPPMLFSGNSLRDNIRGSIFRQKSTSNNKATSRHQRDAEEGPPPVEIIASKEEPEEESHIELDASVGWAEAFKPEKDTSRRPQRRLALICAASVLFLCLLLGLAIGLSGNGKDDSNQTSQSSSAALQGEEQQQQQQQQQSDVAPTEAPVPVDTFVTTPPTDPVVVVTAAPVAAPPTMSPTFPVPVPDTAAPTQVCANTLSSVSPCHEPFQEIAINFSNCEPRVDDWIGIWPAGSDPSSLPEPTLWLWTCGTQDCTTAVDQGSVFFFGFENIADGSYAAHLVRLVEDQAPYTSTYAISGAFDITSATCT